MMRLAAPDFKISGSEILTFELTFETDCVQVADSLQRFLNSSTDPAELGQFTAACYQNDPNNFLATSQRIMTANGAALPPATSPP